MSDGKEPAWHYAAALALLSIPSLIVFCCAVSKKPTVTPQPVECTQWEYKLQYSVPKPQPERKGNDAALATAITPGAEELTALGKDGWELAGLVLENETAYPQFDKVAVPNVRPQRLVLFFKRKNCQK
jgi:hypothetical protein